MPEPSNPAPTTPRTRSGAGPSDAALVVAARAGEAWAHEALFRRHGPRVNGLAFRLLGRDDEIDDLVQDAFVAAFQSLDRLDDAQSFSAWLMSIVCRQAYKKIRHRRMLARIGLGRSLAAVDVDAAIAPSTPPDEAVELRNVYRKIDLMPADMRVPLVLHRIEGFGLEEVAEMTGMSLATVRRRIKSADEILHRDRDGGQR